MTVQKNILILPYKVDKYTMHVHCRKIWNLFVQALETGSKMRFWQAFLQVQMNCIYLGNVFDSGYCDIHAYTVTVSYCQQKNYILVSDRI